jgi:aspartate ammonia-lyase
MPTPSNGSKLPKKIKLIWDFRGLTSGKTAEHHEIHLKQYSNAEKLTPNITGFEVLNEMHAIAFMVVTDDTMIQVRDALKPHRGEVY